MHRQTRRETQRLMHMQSCGRGYGADRELLHSGNPMDRRCIEMVRTRRGVGSVCAALLLAVLSTTAWADDLTFTDYADVESVEPIVKRERISEPVKMQANRNRNRYNIHLSLFL